MKGITKIIISCLMYAVQKPKGFGTKLKKVILTSLGDVINLPLESIFLDVQWPK